MSPKNPDAWLWIGLAVLGYYGCMTIRPQLMRIREASRITHNEQPAPVLDQQTEDGVNLHTSNLKGLCLTLPALKPETLGQLAKYPTLDIQDASKKIITERMLQDDVAWRIMLRDISGSDCESRDKALTCLRFLLPSCKTQLNPDDQLAISLTLSPRVAQYGEKTGILVFTKSTLRAVVDCLCNMLPEAHAAEHGHPNEADHRSQFERDCLHVLSYIIPVLVTESIDAGVISRWLSNYPFGGPDASSLRREQCILGIWDGSQECYEYEDDDFGYSMRTLLSHILSHQALFDEVLKYKLIQTKESIAMISRSTAVFHPLAGPVGEAGPGVWDRIPLGAVRADGAWVAGGWLIPDESDLSVETFVSVPHGAIRTSEGYTEHGGDRPREESAEEIALRRSRREAMVLGEFGRPLQPEDIIQRDPAMMGEEVD